MAKDNFVPISQLESGRAFDVDDFRGGVPLLWNVSLPPTLDQDKILLDVDRLNLLHKIGCVAGSEVSTYDGERTTYSANIVDINTDGSAVAGKVSVAKKAETSKGSVFDADFDTPPIGMYGLSIARLQLNKPEIVSKVADRKQSQSLDREQAWTIELNKAIRGSLNESVRKKLIKRSAASLIEIGYLGGIVTTSVLTANTAMLMSNYFIYEATTIGALSAISKFLCGRTNLDKKTWSLFAYSHPDRYLAFTTLNASSRLLKVAK
jgi:hypothetical protein